MKQAELFLKIPFFRAFHRFGIPKLLPFNYTFLISTQCNSRCLTCNIWKQKHQELTLENWKKVFRSLDQSPFWVTISGGEPFLQNHLAEMVVALDQICQPAIINIPTNSLLPEKIKDRITKILEQVHDAQLVINLSLDGVGSEHDRIRGIPGNFEKVIQNYKNLKKLTKKYSNLTIGFGTVISRFNLQFLKTTFDFVLKMEPDQYVTEIAENRVELNTMGLAITPKYSDYTRVIDILINRIKDCSFEGIGNVSRAFRFEYYQFVKDWLAGRKLLPDYAGFASVEITSWGEVWPSCIKGEKMGNIKDTNFDFKKVWFSKKADQIRVRINKQGSSYPLANSFYSSALLHFPTLFKVFRRIILP